MPMLLENSPISPPKAEKLDYIESAIGMKSKKTRQKSNDACFLKQPHYNFYLELLN
jgi:hypothetical protein